MSFDTLRPYFQSVMATVDPDLREWEDAFNIENIPATILDKSWHIEFGSMVYAATTHNSCFHFACPVLLQVMVAGNRSPKEAIDTGHKLADAILREACKATNRLTQVSIKNVLPESVNVRSFDPTNDNIVVLEVRLNCEIILHL